MPANKGFSQLTDKVNEGRPRSKPLLRRAGHNCKPMRNYH